MRVRHGGERLHRAGCDHHAFGDVGPAGDGRGDILGVVRDGGQALDVLALHLVLVPDVEHARVSEHEVALPPARFLQGAQERDAVDRARRAGDAYDKPLLQPFLYTIFFAPPSQVPTTLPSVCLSASMTSSVNLSTPFFLILASISVFSSLQSFFCA